MRLADLCAALDLPAPVADPEITGVTHNAAWVRPGEVFVAIRGAKVDGHNFAVQAAEQGAAAIFGEGWLLPGPCPLPYVKVPEARAALADLAADWKAIPAAN